MKVSVIVPVYNVEKYLYDCIDSVLCQTYDQYELILIDDGSSDRSGQICDQYKILHPEKIRVIHTENIGPLYARIQGIEIALGDVLLFLDSDDTIRRDTLEIVNKCFTEQRCDMVMYNAGLCSEFSSRRIAHPFDDGKVFDYNSKEKLYQMLVSSQIPNSVCLKTIKKSCVSLPTYFSKFYKVKHGEDLLMSAYFLTNCKKIVYLNQGLYHYRIRPGSAVALFNPQRTESIKVVHEEIGKLIDIWEMPWLKPVHNARKVKGWVEALKLLLINKKSISKEEFRKYIREMASDPYFISAYADMDSSKLPRSYRIFALLLTKRQFLVIDVLHNLMRCVSKIKSLFFRRNHG